MPSDQSLNGILQMDTFNPPEVELASLLPQSDGRAHAAAASVQSVL